MTNGLVDLWMSHCVPDQPSSHRHTPIQKPKTPPIDLTLLSIMKILKIPINLNSRKGLHSNLNNEESYGTFVV